MVEKAYFGSVKAIPPPEGLAYPSETVLAGPVKLPALHPIPKFAIRPEVKIVPINVGPRTMYVFQEGYLPCGTKQRALPVLLARSEKELVYTGANSGAAQVLVAYAASLSGKTATIFTREEVREHAMLKRARAYGAKIVSVKGGVLAELQARATEYAKRRGAYLVPFGLNDPRYKQELLESLRAAIPEAIRETSKTIWLTYGSGVLLSVLLEVFPYARFEAVVVGRKPSGEEKQELGPDLQRTGFHEVPFPFHVPTKDLPPYASIPEYDAKVWFYVVKFARNGDFIWNTASC